MNLSAVLAGYYNEVKTSCPDKTAAFGLPSIGGSLMNNWSDRMQSFKSPGLLQSFKDNISPGMRAPLSNYQNVLPKMLKGQNEHMDYAYPGATASGEDIQNILKLPTTLSGQAGQEAPSFSPHLNKAITTTGAATMGAAGTGWLGGKLNSLAGKMFGKSIPSFPGSGRIAAGTSTALKTLGVAGDMGLGYEQGSNPLTNEGYADLFNTTPEKVAPYVGPAYAGLSGLFSKLNPWGATGALGFNRSMLDQAMHKLVGGQIRSQGMSDGSDLLMEAYKKMTSPTSAYADRLNAAGNVRAFGDVNSSNIYNWENKFPAAYHLYQKANQEAGNYY